MRTGYCYLISLSVCLSVRLTVCQSVCLSVPLSVCLSVSVSVSICVCVTFVVFTDRESCTRPISTNPGSTKAGEYGLTRGTCFVTRAVSRWSRSPGCCGFRGALWVRREFVFSMNLHFQIGAHDLWLRETQRSQRRLSEGATTVSQFAHRELAPTNPHQVYHLLCSHLRIMASVDR